MGIVYLFGDIVLYTSAIPFHIQILSELTIERMLKNSTIIIRCSMIQTKQIMTIDFYLNIEHLLNFLAINCILNASNRGQTLIRMRLNSERLSSTC